MKIVYGACCGNKIAAYETGSGPGTEGWVKPNACPVCGKDGEQIDYRKMIIVRDDISDTIRLIHEGVGGEVSEPKPTPVIRKKRGGFRP